MLLQLDIALQLKSGKPSYPVQAKLVVYVNEDLPLAQKQYCWRIFKFSQTQSFFCHLTIDSPLKPVIVCSLCLIRFKFISYFYQTISSICQYHFEFYFSLIYWKYHWTQDVLKKHLIFPLHASYIRLIYVMFPWFVYLNSIKSLSRPVPQNLRSKGLIHSEIVS